MLEQVNVRLVQKEKIISVIIQKKCHVIISEKGNHLSYFTVIEINVNVNSKCDKCFLGRLPNYSMSMNSNCNNCQIRKLRIWSHLLKKSLMENFIFCAVIVTFPADIY